MSFAPHQTDPLREFGLAVRRERSAQHLSRKALAEKSGLSLRFLAEVESGRGNISYLKLRSLAAALGLTGSSLIARAEASPETSRPIVLLGMRGAGKTSVGGELSHRLGIPFQELDELVEDAAELELGQIFELQGDAYYRKLEREALARFLESPMRAVLAAGGGIVTESETFGLLRSAAFTVWLKATPREHWNRVVAQGDRRPMSNRDDAMTELVRLWNARSPLYEQAHLVVDTSSLTVREVADRILAAIPPAAPNRPSV